MPSQRNRSMHKMAFAASVKSREEERSRTLQLRRSAMAGSLSPLLLLLVAFTTASLLQERQGEVDGVVHVHEHEHDNSHKHKQRHYNKHEHSHKQTGKHIHNHEHVHNHRHVHDHGHEAAHSEEHKHTVAGEHRHKHWRLYRPV